MYIINMYNYKYFFYATLKKKYINQLININQIHNVYTHITHIQIFIDH